MRIPKDDGSERLLGIAALEDKVVQRAVVTVLNYIYEEDFLGFRPGRDPHRALDAHARQRRGFGWKRWSRQWLYEALGVFNDYRVRYQPRTGVAV